MNHFKNYTKSESLHVLAGTDFIEVIDLPVIFEASEHEKRVTIETVGDDVVEVTEEFRAEISTVSDRVLLTEDTVTISIEETTNGTHIQYY